ncbi:MAG: hypothetical protein M1327_07445 [Candidatus Thermoplasmatota archaeon]|nr:hypothetical protein [Candidatus Thermoplasmatota archaeon]
MKLTETIAIFSFILGGISLIIGLFLWLFLEFSIPNGYYLTYEPCAEVGIILMALFWAIAIGMGRLPSSNTPRNP